MSEADTGLPARTPGPEKSREKTTVTEQPLRLGLASWLYHNPAPALTIAGVLIYAFLRFNYALFYGKMGLTPEDVGMTYISTLAQTIGLVAYILYFIIVTAARVLLAFLLAMFFMPIGAFLASIKSKRPLLGYMAFGIFVVIPLLYVVVSFLYPPLPSRPRYLLREEEDAVLFIAVLASTLGMAVGFRIKMPPELQAHQLKRIARHVWNTAIDVLKGVWSLRSLLVPFGVYTAFLLLLMGAVAVPVTVVEYANKVKAGESVRGVLLPVVDLPVLTLHAESVLRFHRRL